MCDFTYYNLVFLNLLHFKVWIWTFAREWTVIFCLQKWGGLIWCSLSKLRLISAICIEWLYEHVLVLLSHTQSSWAWYSSTTPLWWWIFDIQLRIWLYRRRFPGFVHKLLFSIALVVDDIYLIRLIHFIIECIYNIRLWWFWLCLTTRQLIFTFEKILIPCYRFRQKLAQRGLWFKCRIRFLSINIWSSCTYSLNILRKQISFGVR